MPPLVDVDVLVVTVPVDSPVDVLVIVAVDDEVLVEVSEELLYE